MRKIVILSTLLLLSIFTCIHSQNLLISTNSEDAMIYINDEFIGNESVNLQLDSGEYNLFVVERNRGWDTKRYADTVKIDEDGDEIVFNYTFEKRIHINTIPQNASIMYHDSLLGYTPLEIDLHYSELLVHKNDYSSRKILLADFNPAETIKLNFEGQNREKHFVDTPWFGILIGSAVILGATAAYFKIEADQKYDEYNLTRNKELLDEINRLDLYSGISFAMLQINFGYLIYEFIFDK